MKPEAAQYLDKARQALKEAHAVAGIELAEAAGRAAYLAAFHAAQALIFERNAKVPKTHRGVHAQFSRLAKDTPELGALSLTSLRFQSSRRLRNRARRDRAARGSHLCDGGGRKFRRQGYRAA